MVSVLLFSGEHLKNIRAYPFDHNIPEGFHQELRDVTKQKNSDPNKKKLHRDIKSEAGQIFKSFVKKISEDPEGKTLDSLLKKHQKSLFFQLKIVLD